MRETYARALVMFIAKGYGIIITFKGLKPFFVSIIPYCVLYAIAEICSLHIEDARHTKIIAVRDNILWSMPVNAVNFAIMIYIFVSFTKTLNYLETHNLDLKAKYLKKLLLVYAVTCLVEFGVSLVEVGFRLVDPDLDKTYKFIWFWDKHPLLSFTGMLLGYILVLQPSQETATISDYSTLKDDLCEVPTEADEPENIQNKVVKPAEE